MLKSLFGDLRCLPQIYCIDVWQRLRSSETICIHILNLLLSMNTVYEWVLVLWKLLIYCWNSLVRWVNYWDSLGNGGRQWWHGRKHQENDMKWSQMSLDRGETVQNGCNMLWKGCKMGQNALKQKNMVGNGSEMGKMG